MTQKSYQRYTADFKERALGLLALGKAIAEVAQDLQISTNLLYSWRSRAHGTNVNPPRKIPKKTEQYLPWRVDTLSSKK